MDLLKKQNNALEHELNTTRKKLESLTQIERQLSSRKQGASVDAISQEEALSDVQSSDASNTENQLINRQRSNLIRQRQVSNR